MQEKRRIDDEEANSLLGSIINHPRLETKNQKHTHF